MNAHTLQPDQRIKVAVIGGGIGGLSITYLLAKLKVSVDLYHSPHKQTVSRLAQGVATLKGHHMAHSDLFAAKIAGHRELVDIFNALSFADTASQVTELFTSRQAYYRQVTRTYHRKFRGFCTVTSRQLNPESSHLYPLYPMAHDYPDDYVFCASSFCDQFNTFVHSLLHQTHGRVMMKTIDPKDIFTWPHDHVVIAVGAHTPKWLETYEIASHTSHHHSTAAVARFHQASHPGSDLDRWLKHTSQIYPSSPQKIWGFKQGIKSLRITKHPRYFMCTLGSIDTHQNSHQNNPQLSHSFHKLKHQFGLHSEEHGAYSFHWGHRYAGAQNKPIIGEITSLMPHPKPRVWLFCGFHKSGYALAPSLSHSLAHMILSDSYSHDRPLRQAYISPIDQFAKIH